MKKIIKKICFFLLVIMTLVIYTNKVYAADTCASRSVDVCENQKVDENGKPCIVKYAGNELQCTENDDAKQCAGFSYTECPEEDDYGNKCASKNQTCTPVENYEYHAPKYCYDFDKDSCLSGMLDDFGNVCEKDSGGGCYISTSNQACSSIKDYGRCVARDDCDWDYDNYYTAGKCLKKIKPTQYSTACGDITDLDECQARTDCETKSSISGLFCTDINKSSSGGKKGGSGSYITTDDTPFKCSDVKYLTGAWTLIRIAAPFIVILFGSLDFIKAVMASDEKKMKETKGKFIKRVIAFVLLILLPFVVQFIFSNMGTYGSDNMCLVKCIVTNNTAEEECD